MMQIASDDLILTVGQTSWQGWTTIRLTRGVERCPSDFEISLTERYPGGQAVIFNAGDPCQVKLGADLVVTGYIDRVVREIDKGRHDVTVIGRGKCQDLVDCSAEFPGCQINGSDIVSIASKLAAPYDITVSTAHAPAIGAPLPAFNITLTETPFSIIEEMARYYAVLAYEGPDGNLIIAALGQEKAASGFTLGANVLAAKFTSAVDQRYSDYKAFLLSMDVLGDLGSGGNLKASVSDPAIKRHRLHAIIAEAPSGGQDIAAKRAYWEMARRAGRGAAIELTADSWRDSAGKLWTPNTLAPVSLAALDVPEAAYAISQVTYRKDREGGTTADLVLMPPAAFSPEPILLQPTLPDLSLSPSQ